MAMAEATAKPAKNEVARTRNMVTLLYYTGSTTLLQAPAPSGALSISLSVARSLANTRDTARTACHNPVDCCGRGDDLAHRPCERKPSSSVFFFQGISLRFMAIILRKI